MSKHRFTALFCAAVLLATLLATAALMAFAGSGIAIIRSQPEYAARLFDTGRVHEINIIAAKDEWDGMLENAQAEEYIQAAVVIDGETVPGIGIRPKGNSSLSMIQSADSDRYSFKIEFDHYAGSITYHGLDKLALNNIAQDNTYLKDYISYQMMNAMGVYAPLSSFIWVKVNGVDWGLYLAVEGVEEAFAARVYGNEPVNLYKPDSMDIGGGMADRVRDTFTDTAQEGTRNMPQGGQMPGFSRGEMPSGENIPGAGTLPEMQGGFMGRFSGFGGGQTSLTYTDDDPDSYSIIFDNTVFKAGSADKQRLIQALKTLNEGTDAAAAVNADEVIRYFAVHNFTLNSDSYTGSLTHNYYLSEQDGKLSMVAWDYNLAFGGMGGFGGGMGNMSGGTGQSGTAVDNATTLANYPIDSPMLAGSVEDKPMIAWIFSNEEYLAQYHEALAGFMTYFNSGGFAGMYDNAVTLISPYVDKDPTAFCTYEDFLKGSAELREFCLLRAESITGQLNGTIAATGETQASSGYAGFIDASGVDIASMGSNEMGFGRARNAWFLSRSMNGTASPSTEPLGGTDALPRDGDAPQITGGMFPEGMQGMFPDGAEGTPPEGMQDMFSSDTLGGAATDPAETDTAVSVDAGYVLIASVAALGAGILFAGKRRRV